jgi:hypothetical protein
MSEELGFGDTTKLNEREKELKEFLEQMFDESDRPYFIADEASIYDIYAGDDSDFAKRCERCYGYRLAPSDFRLPLWKLLDVLYHRLL